MPAARPADRWVGLVVETALAGSGRYKPGPTSRPPKVPLCLAPQGRIIPSTNSYRRTTRALGMRFGTATTRCRSIQRRIRPFGHEAESAAFAHAKHATEVELPLPA